ncbi:hypothetical protein P7C71_g1312, partial [Lecanoromycetidae sp. Uapishka_2]
MDKNPTKMLFLTGAPLPRSLRWDEHELSVPLLPAFVTNTEVKIQGAPVSSDQAPSWRALPIKQPFLPTGFTQASREGCSFYGHDDSVKETSFLSTANLSISSTKRSSLDSQNSPVLNSANEESLSQYYEHSFAIHEDLPSSQIVGPASFENRTFITESDDSTMVLTADSETDSGAQLIRLRLASSQLSDLKDMPNATYLLSIIPQTMTVNLVVGIISISQPRTITTRRGGKSVELVEMIVGDETRTGFGINIWLPSHHESNHYPPREKGLASEILGLRPRDIVLAKQVALSSFNGMVYGQSLRRDMTTLDLLYRNIIDDEDRRGAFKGKDLMDDSMGDAQMRKLKRVKDWVVRFVGDNTATSSLRRRKPSLVTQQRQLQTLPNDTP